MTKIKELLKESKNLLETKGWCKWAFAENSEGKACKVIQPEAISFCILGAMQRIIKDKPNEYSYDDYLDATNELFQALNKSISVNVYNDLPTTTKQDIINLFDKAINQE